MKTAIKAVLMLLLFITVACGDNSTGDESPTEIVVVINAPATATVGTVVMLDGSDSTGPITAYGWLMISQPQSSEARISNSNSVEAQFTPDVEGEYVVRLNAISDKVLADSDEVTITVSADN